MTLASELHIPSNRASKFFAVTGGWIAWVGYIFLILPSLIIIPLSLGDSSELDFPPRTLSFGLYQRFFSDPSWWGTALQSARIATLTTIAALVVAVPASYALVRGEFRGREALNVFLLSPILVPVVVLGLGFYLHFIGLGIASTNLSLVIGHTIIVAPLVIVSVSSGLRNIDPALETVAMIMGASRARIFFVVVLPQIRPSIAVGALFAFLMSFDEVVVSYFITGPSTQTLPVKMFSAIRWEISPVIAAVSTLLTVLSLAVCLMIMALQRREDRE